MKQSTGADDNQQTGQVKMLSVMDERPRMEPPERLTLLADLSCVLLARGSSVSELYERIILHNRFL